jgi:uncharacterized cupin superfamily protein
MAEGYTLKRIDDLEEMEGSGGATWRLARKSLGADSFGFNVVDLDPGGELPEHDEAQSGQEEIYIVLDGEATLVADGEELSAPAGTFCRYGTEVRRTVRNKSESPIRLLLIGVPADSGYEPMSWA